MQVGGVAGMQKASCKEKGYICREIETLNHVHKNCSEISKGCVKTLFLNIALIILTWNRNDIKSDEIKIRQFMP